MTDRVTKSDVEGKMEMLSEKTGREYRLERWSPGDGWTRNQLLMKDDRRDSLVTVTNVLKTREMYQFIRGYLRTERLLRTDGEVDYPPYLWRYREEDGGEEFMDVLFITEPSESFQKSNPGETTIITWR